MSEQLVKRLRELSNAVTRADWNEFSMRIPAEKDRDADFVLLQAANKIAALEADAARYETVRKLNAEQFAQLFRKNIETGVHFDVLVDELAAMKGGA